MALFGNLAFFMVCKTVVAVFETIVSLKGLLHHVPIRLDNHLKFYNNPNLLGSLFGHGVDVATPVVAEGPGEFGVIIELETSPPISTSTPFSIKS